MPIMEDPTPPLPENPSLRSAAALRELEQRAQAALAASRDQVLRLEAEISSQLEQIARALQEQTAADSVDAAEIDRARAEAERVRADAERFRAEAERLQSEFEQARVARQAERTALEAARDEMAQQVARLEADHRAQNEQWQAQLAEFEQKLSEQQAARNDQRSAWSQEREGLEHENRELQQKFDLALEDVQRLRGRVTELEQELARRPESNEADSAELVALRAERDALSERVEQLEREPPTRVDASSEQQMADLQRRFELAVEDVRELKTKNAQLESRLASAGKQPAASADSGGSDWESQKRRLLASLEGEGDDPDDSQRQRERVSIENTIEMTDAVVAEKDSQIAQLKAQLAAAGQAGSTRDDDQNDKIREIVDADEVIAEHRRRIAELEREIEEKLRTAELELSVERAKLARQKAEVDDLRAELESQRSALDAHAPGSAAGMPRRRWLSKLGLSGEEQ
jgi:chromosome segregation ATPase